jgi:pyrimidine deaminase RibD-like protein/DNA-binding LacI/PurR family transcriptional regulator
MTDLFLSFAEEDQGPAEWLERQLQRRGYSTFCYAGNRSAGSSVSKNVADAIRQSKCCMVFVSPDALESRWVLDETTFARSRRVPLLPLLLGLSRAHVIGSESPLELLIADSDLLPLTGRWEQDGKYIIRGLKRLGIEPSVEPQGFPEPNDSFFLKKVIEIALSKSEARDKHGTPRPRVGAALVADGVLIDYKARTKHGEHAEQLLIETARLIPQNATLYTTLEPCSKAHGKRGSCSDLIRNEPKIRRVVIGGLDPNPEMRGRGVSALLERQKEVVLASPEIHLEARNANAEYVEFFINAAKKTRDRVLVAVPGFKDMPFFAELMRAILVELAATHKLDGVAVVSRRDNDVHEQHEFLRSIEEHPSDYQALIVFPAPPIEELRAHLRDMPVRLRKPLVFLDLDPFKKEGEEGDTSRYPDMTYFVASDSGAVTAATFLQKILPPPTEDPQILVLTSNDVKPERGSQFSQLMTQAGYTVQQIPCDNLYRRDGRTAAQKALHKAAEAGVEVAAIYAITDELAIGAAEVLLDYQTKTDVFPMVLGFDGLREMKLRMEVGPIRLATLAQNVEQIARTAVAAIIFELYRQGKAPSVRTEHPVELCVPESLSSYVAAS